jgi:hypothetical protein
MAFALDNSSDMEQYELWSAQGTGLNSVSTVISLDIGQATLPLWEATILSYPVQNNTIVVKS